MGYIYTRIVFYIVLGVSIEWMSDRSNKSLDEQGLGVESPSDEGVDLLLGRSTTHNSS